MSHLLGVNVADTPANDADGIPLGTVSETHDGKAFGDELKSIIQKI